MNSMMREQDICQCSSQTNGRIAPMAEHRFEGPTALVRIQLRPLLRVWCNGGMTVSKTVGIGSNPLTRAKKSGSGTLK